jgi:hypothetical protein
MDVRLALTVRVPLVLDLGGNHHEPPMPHTTLRNHALG